MGLAVGDSLIVGSERSFTCQRQVRNQAKADISARTAGRLWFSMIAPIPYRPVLDAAEPSTAKPS